MRRTTGDISAILALCKYYKGEKENPFEKLVGKNGEYRNHLDRDRASLWFYESKFAEMMRTDEGRRSLNASLAEYRDYRGKSLPNVHELLLGLLFNRFFHWSSASPSDPEAMKSFYRFVKKFY